MILRALSFFCVLSYSTIIFAVEPSPFVRRTEPQIPSYLLRKPEVYNLQCPGTRPCHWQGYGVCFPDYPAHAALAGNYPRHPHRAT